VYRIKGSSGTLENPGTDVARKRGLNRAIQRQGWGLFDVFTFPKEAFGAEATMLAVVEEPH